MQMISLDRTTLQAGQECFQNYLTWSLSRHGQPACKGVDMIPGAIMAAYPTITGEVLIKAVSRATGCRVGTVRRILERLGDECYVSWPHERHFIPVDPDQEALIGGENLAEPEAIPRRRKGSKRAVKTDLIEDAVRQDSKPGRRGPIIDPNDSF